MTRRKRRVHVPQSVSLFPFLAVLICTFGVLIILLVIVVKAADNQAENARLAQEEVHRQQVAKVQDELELQKIRVAGIKSIRPGLVKKLQAEKSQRAHIQSDIHRLTDELELLSIQFNTLETVAADIVDGSELALQLGRLQRQLKDESYLLAKKKLSSNSITKTTYSIVPYDSPGGSARRPVYVECLENEIVIQPYGIRLSARDFVQPVLPNNPLDAALITIKEYFLKNDLADGDTPYPLLIVRPQGAVTYAVARHAIKTWDEQFGYELIPRDMELEYGEPDLQLKRQIQLAVDAAKSRQQDFLVRRQLNQVQRDAAVRKAGGGMHASGQFGGFVKPDGRIIQASGRHESAKTKESVNHSDAEGNADSGATQKADIEISGLDGQGQRSMADDKGKNWALPSSADGAVAYRRPVKLLLRSHSVVMMAGSAGNRPVTIALNDPRAGLEELVRAIWVRMESWGIAGVSGYWIPQLNVVVEPGAELRFEQMKRMLHDSGVEIREYQP